MPFRPSTKEKALFKSRRCCCVCHGFKGRSIDVHHIVQEADGGGNTVENSIVLCHECHAEAGHYNSHHPLGNKYSPSELKKHRNAWWKWCRVNVSAPLPHDPIALTPLQILIPDGMADVHAAVFLSNQVPQVLFDVCVNLTVEASDLRASEIEFPDKVTDHHNVTVHELTASFDMIMVQGVDELGRQGIYIHLAQVMPGGNVVIPLRTRKGSAKVAGRISISLVEWSEIQTTSVTSGPNHMARTVKLYGGFTVQAIRTALRIQT